jgi:hypothetical protein
VAAGFHAAIDRIDGRLGGWFVFDLVAETIDIQEIIVRVKARLGWRRRWSILVPKEMSS